MKTMDPSQNPHQPEQISSESYNTLPSSQIQPSSYAYEPDQSTYAYYPSSYQYAYYDAAQQMAYDYSNAYYQQPQHEPPTSAHPPAAPFPPQPQSDPAAAAHYQYSYYPPPQPQGVEYGGVYGSAAAIHSGTPTAQILQPSHRGTSKRGGRIFRGAGRGRRGQVQPPPQGYLAPVWPPRMAWCELCRVECNTPEILEQHKNGKKHKKNLKVQEELQRVMAAGHNVQSSSSQVQPEVAYQPKETEGSEPPPEGNLSMETVNGRSEQRPQENLPSQALGEENKAEPEHPKSESTRDSGESQGRGPKRKISGGRGGKKLRSHDGRRKPAEPPKPKQIIPLICELCNVTCESQVVFQSHLKGKKHLSNRKRFEESQAVFGQAATQSLYPALQAVHPALPQPNAGLATSLDPKFQKQNVPAGQGFSTQPAPSVLPQGQASTPTPAAIPALPPPLLQSLDHQDPSLQGSKPVDEASAQK